MVDQSLHARVHAERVLAWQQFGVAVPVQAHATREQLLEVFHISVSVDASSAVLLDVIGSVMTKMQYVVRIKMMFFEKWYVH